MILIPTDIYPRYTQRVTIEDNEYIFDFDYNSREDRIYLSIGLTDGTYIVRGWKLITGVAYGPRIADRRLFSGVLTVETNNAKDRSPPGLGELGEGLRCQLYYLAADEL